MSSPYSTITQSSPISELIKAIKYSFRECEFNEVQNILTEREKNMRIEMENLIRDRDSIKKEVLSFESFQSLTLLEKLNLEEKLQKSERKHLELNEKMSELKEKNLAQLKCWDEEMVKIGEEMEHLRWEKSVFDQTEENLRRQLLEADRTVEELRCKLLEADRVVEDPKRQNVEINHSGGNELNGIDSNTSLIKKRKRSSTCDERENEVDKLLQILQIQKLHATASKDEDVDASKDASGEMSRGSDVQVVGTISAPLQVDPVAAFSFHSKENIKVMKPTVEPQNKIDIRGNPKQLASDFTFSRDPPERTSTRRVEISDDEVEVQNSLPKQAKSSEPSNSHPPLPPYYDQFERGYNYDISPAYDEIFDLINERYPAPAPDPMARAKPRTFDPANVYMPNWNVMNTSSIFDRGVSLEFLNAMCFRNDLNKFLVMPPNHLLSRCAATWSQVALLMKALSLQSDYWYSCKMNTDLQIAHLKSKLENDPLNKELQDQLKKAEAGLEELRRTYEQEVKERAELDKKRAEKLGDLKCKVSSLEMDLDSSRREAQAAKKNFEARLAELELKSTTSFREGYALGQEEYPSSDKGKKLRFDAVRSFVSFSTFKDLVSEKSSDEGLKYWKLCQAQLTHLDALKSPDFLKQLDPMKNERLEDDIEVEDDTANEGDDEFACLHEELSKM